MSNNLKPTFFTSDWHVGHKNVLEYDQRPFSSLEEMHDGLINRYNATVPKNGVCFFLGDVGFRPRDIKSVITQLNGTKIIVLGNHDHGMNTMYNCGFDVVTYTACIYISDNRITMSHCPLLGIKREDTSDMKGGHWFENWHGESKLKNSKFTLKDEGQFHLHGHIHSRPGRPSSQKILDRQFDVGVAANNYTPVSISQIESWVMNYEKK